MIGLTCKGLLIGDDNEGSGGRLSEDIWTLAPRSLGFELKRVIRPAASSRRLCRSSLFDGYP